jgi:hypothetical protein
MQELAEYYKQMEASKKVIGESKAELIMDEQEYDKNLKNELIMDYAGQAMSSLLIADINIEKMELFGSIANMAFIMAEAMYEEYKRRYNET